MDIMMTAMFGQLGVENNACVSIVVEQDINSLEELRALKDTKVTYLCKVVRRPGGRLAAVGIRPTIPDHGENVSLRAENNTQACLLLVATSHLHWAHNDSG